MRGALGALLLVFYGAPPAVAADVTSSPADCEMLGQVFTRLFKEAGSVVVPPIKTRLMASDLSEGEPATTPAAQLEQRRRLADELRRSLPGLSRAEAMDLARGHERDLPASYTLNCQWPGIRFTPRVPRPEGSAPTSEFYWVPPIRSASGRLALVPHSTFLAPHFHSSGLCLFDRRAVHWRLRTCVTTAIT